MHKKNISYIHFSLFSSSSSTAPSFSSSCPVSCWCNWQLDIGIQHRLRCTGIHEYLINVSRFTFTRSSGSGQLPRHWSVLGPVRRTRHQFQRQPGVRCRDLVGEVMMSSLCKLCSIKIWWWKMKFWDVLLISFNSYCLATSSQKLRTSQTTRPSGSSAACLHRYCIIHVCLRLWWIPSMPCCRGRWHPLSLTAVVQIPRHPGETFI